MRALGLDEAAMGKPSVGVMSTHGENTPCSLSLRPQAEAAKLSVAAAGGTPFEFSHVKGAFTGAAANKKGSPSVLRADGSSSHRLDPVERDVPHHLGDLVGVERKHRHVGIEGLLWPIPRSLLAAARVVDLRPLCTCEPG